MATKKKKAAKRKPAKKKAAKKKSVKKTVKKAARKSVKKTAKKSAKKRTAPKAKKTARKKMTTEQLLKFVGDKVESYVKRLYRGSYERHDDGRFLCFEGSTCVQTVIRPWHEDDVVVESFSYVVQNATINESLCKFLLRENAVIHFGAFGLTFDGTILFSNSLAGANLDENEFRASIKSVARIADYYDNKIVEMAGGMTAREAMNKGII